MKYVLIFLMTIGSLSAQKSFDVHLTTRSDGSKLDIKYVDDNEDAIFDRLIIIDDGEIFEELLPEKMTQGGPDPEKYKDCKFEVKLKNYNDLYEDAYFQVKVTYKEEVLGYWEHLMGSYRLIWKENN